MALGLHNLQRAKGAAKKRKRVGRGNASTGTYSGRGQKGQRARSGGAGGLKRKGLQSMLRNKPKITGFHSLKAKKTTVNIKQLEKAFAADEVVTAKKMIQKNLIKSVAGGVKVLGDGTLTKKMTVIADAFSEGAKKAIEEAGGKAELRVVKKDTKLSSKKK